MRALLRCALGLLALSAASVGIPALVDPHGFYDDFPLGEGWVRALPPYNEHLTTDVGALYLGFTVLFAWAAATLQRTLVVPVCVAWSVFSVAHLLFHAGHGEGAPDFALQLASLAGVLVLAVAAGLVCARETPTG
jgi:hypothetical protein